MTGIADIPIEILVVILSMLKLDNEEVLHDLFVVCRQWTNALSIISKTKGRKLPVSCVLLELCKSNKFEPLKYLWECLQDNEIYKATQLLQFRYFCGAGNLSMAQWLASSFNLNAKDARANDNSGKSALRRSCVNGHLSVAQWLTSTFNLTSEDVPNTLTWTCYNGHLDVAQWLTSTFNLTPEDARAENNWALKMSCCNGHLHVAQWLTSSFNLTA
eukprot:m.242333 g.242333  ORF g.242333 m.242333 type:complete len:216 (+) comp16092_c0_seq3:708-1355(+)